MDGVLQMRMSEGSAGYGVYVMLLECLRAADGFQVKNDPAALAWSMHEADVDLVRRIIDKYGLFQITKDGLLSSPWLASVMEPLAERRAKLSAAGRKSAAVKAAQVNQVATTLQGGGQPSCNDVADSGQQDINNNNKKNNQDTQSSGAGVDFGNYLSEDSIKTIGRDHGAPANVEGLAQIWPADKDHNPSIILTRCQEWSLTTKQADALLLVTRGCEVGTPATMALLAAFKHAKETQFKPRFPYEYLISRIKESVQVGNASYAL